MTVQVSWTAEPGEATDADTVAIGTSDIKGAVERVRASGGKVTREPGPMKHGTTVIAFVEDPNGYKVELIQKEGA